MPVVAIVGACAAGAAAVYIGASCVLLRHPQLLHKRRKMLMKSCTHISHRGGAAEQLENTMAAFKHCVSTSGSDMIELDCQITRDGQVVVSHDASLERSCGVQKLINEVDYEDLPQLLTDIKQHFGKNIAAFSADCDRQIPLLRDVFEEFQNVPINVDVKTNDPELMNEVANLIEEYKRESITPWGNFQHKICNACYKRNPNIPQFYSLRECVKLLVYFYTGLLPFMPIRQHCLNTIMPSIVYSRDEPMMVLKPWQTALVKTVDFLLMRPSLIRHLQARGLHVYLWVLNHDDEFEKAFRLGVNGVMTDYPTRLREWLDRNPGLVNPYVPPPAMD